MLFLLILSVSFAALAPKRDFSNHRHDRRENPGGCKSLHFVNVSAVPFASPDRADAENTVNFIFFVNTTGKARIVLQGDAFWPSTTIEVETTGNHVMKVLAPSQPGVFKVFFQSYGVGGQTGPLVSQTIEVTCSASVSNWCEGEKRWIPLSGRCVRTYRPCGIDKRVGVPETDPCFIYPCNAATKSCGRVPVGGAACGECFIPPCIPSCVNKTCGDDGCGGSCGSCSIAGQVCNTTSFSCVPCSPQCTGKVCGDNACFGTCGDCPSSQTCSVDQASCISPSAAPGTCSSPYPLFGVNLPVGSPKLNPNDKNGISYFKLNNSDAYTTEPVKNITSASDWGTVDEFTVPKSGIRSRIFLNTDGYQDLMQLQGNGQGTPDIVFKFVIPPGTPAQAFEAYLLAQNGTVDIIDTFLAFVKPDCTSFQPNESPITPADIPFSDDATPPGAYSSRVAAAALTPGSYFLVVSLYAASNSGPVWLETVFTNATNSACFPTCAGKLCGPNGCGGTCNVVGCSAAQCIGDKCKDCPAPIPTNYAPNCTNVGGLARQCGQDANFCLDSSAVCGVCPSGSICELKFGQCVELPPCNPSIPICNPNTRPNDGGQYFCNSNCLWTELNEPLVEIVPNEEVEIHDTFTMFWRFFDASNCAIPEGCAVPGWNLLLKFDTRISNIGTSTYVAPLPFDRPDLLVYSGCHQHYHEVGFARYQFRDFETGAELSQGGKLSYCVVTNSAFQTGPKVRCANTTSFTCSFQGLEPGNTDSYTSDLDCQWSRLTKSHEEKRLNRWAKYTVAVNQFRAISEYSTQNNEFSWPVFLPCAPAVSEQINILSYLKANPNICCLRPGGPVPGICDGPVGGCANAPKTLPACPEVVLPAKK